MAPRGSNKDISVKHEDYIARLFDGKRSKSSGAAEHDAGDVRSDRYLFECKATRLTVPKWVADFEKVTKEAWSEGRNPVLALRYYKPYGLLADSNGWMDFTIMLANDMCELTSQETCPYTSDNTCAHR